MGTVGFCSVCQCIPWAEGRTWPSKVLIQKGKQRLSGRSKDRQCQDSREDQQTRNWRLSPEWWWLWGPLLSVTPEGSPCLCILGRWWDVRTLKFLFVKRPKFNHPNILECPSPASLGGLPWGQYLGALRLLFTLSKQVSGGTDQEHHVCV